MQLTFIFATFQMHFPYKYCLLLYQIQTFNIHLWKFT